MSSLLEHCHGENWKSPTRSFGRSGKAKRTFRGTKKNAPIPPKEETPMRLLRPSFSLPAPSIRGARLSQTNELPHCGVFVFYD